MSRCGCCWNEWPLGNECPEETIPLDPASAQDILQHLAAHLKAQAGQWTENARGAKIYNTGI